MIFSNETYNYLIGRISCEKGKAKTAKENSNRNAKKI